MVFRLLQEAHHISLVVKLRSYRTSFFVKGVDLSDGASAAHRLPGNFDIQHRGAAFAIGVTNSSLRVGRGDEQLVTLFTVYC